MTRVWKVVEDAEGMEILRDAEELAKAMLVSLLADANSMQYPGEAARLIRSVVDDIAKALDPSADPRSELERRGKRAAFLAGSLAWIAAAILRDLESQTPQGEIQGLRERLTSVYSLPHIDLGGDG